MSVARCLLWLCSLLAVSALSAQEVPSPTELYLPMQMQAGTWDAEVTFYENDQPSGSARGVQVNELLQNGHWISNRFSIPAQDKLPAYQGQGLWGYDPVAKTYVDTWVDTNDGAVRTSYGFWNAASKTMTWSSKHNDGKGHFVDYRIVEEYRDSERVFTFYQLGMAIPNPHPLVRIVFTRRTEATPAGEASAS